MMCVSKVYRELDGEWSGPGADKLKRRCSKVIPPITIERSLLRHIGFSAQKVAKIFKSYVGENQVVEIVFNDAAGF